MNLLYPGYTKAQAITNNKKDERDGNGIILNQTLNMYPGAERYFKQTKSDLGNVTEIHKNYHLILKKHSISIFKSQEPTLKSFDSELIIDYVAYEADDSVNQNKDSNVPTLNNNMYNLLNQKKATTAIGPAFAAGQTKLENAGGSVENKSILQAFTEYIAIYNAQIATLQKAIKCKKTNAFFNPGTQTEVDDSLPYEEYVKKANEKIKFLENNIKILKEQFSVNLFRLMINNLDIYEFKINAANIVAFEESIFFNAFMKTFSGNFQTNVVAGTSVGALFGGVGGAGIGAGVATVGTAAQATYAASQEKGVVINKGVGLLRQNFKNITITKIFSKGQDTYANFIAGTQKKAMDAAKKTKISNLLPNAPPHLVIAEEGIRAIRILGTVITEDEREAERLIEDPYGLVQAAQAASEVAIQEALKEQTEKALAIEQSDQEVPVRFVLLGQLIELMPKDKDVSVVFGGKAVPIDKSFNSIYLNYYYVPIDYYKFLNFLNDKLIKSGNINYSAEIYLREIVETFLKNAILTEETIATSVKDIVPTTINTNVHLLDGETQNYKDFLNNISKNILIPDNYKKLKADFMLSKNLNPKRGRKKALKKIYTITADEEIKYYNFYKSYDTWKRKNHPNKPNTTDLFQEYIIKDHAMPCIRTKAVDTFGSILINKNLSFSRKDNPNLVTGQILDSNGVLRIPYNFTGAFKPYIFFFLDISSFVYVAPPDRRDGTIDIVDTFGYGGLYLIKNSSFEYNFQLMDSNNAPTMPNEKSKCDLTGVLVSYGDGFTATNRIITFEEDADACPIDTDPANIGQIAQPSLSPLDPNRPRVFPEEQ